MCPYVLIPGLDAVHKSNTGEEVTNKTDQGSCLSASKIYDMNSSLSVVESDVHSFPTNSLRSHFNALRPFPLSSLLLV